MGTNNTDLSLKQLYLKIDDGPLLETMRIEDMDLPIDEAKYCEADALVMSKFYIYYYMTNNWRRRHHLAPRRRINRRNKK